jgi:Protein of unknown function (DUF1553)/Protein of unknown function (DUF1549)/Planctomycete cytochrome C
VRSDRLVRSRRALARFGLGAGAALVLTALASGAPAQNSAAAPNAEQEAFFESKVRPLLVARCFRCHGEKEQKNGLRLDLADGVLGKTPDEAVVKPGHPESSRLMEVIGYKDDPKMPPDGKLSDADTHVLREWIRRGAYFPAQHDAAALRLSSPDGIVEAKRTMWSLQPVTSPVPPAVKDSSWVKTPIDQFVLSKLEANGLTPSPAIDRRTLLRRLSFDLIGLPPTYEEVKAFEADGSPTALERVVDRLLASPLYGERWGRHWLDVARYSDTKGYVFTEERRYPFSYTYRDYVIDAFNKDLPFDRFIVEQLAADQLFLPKDHGPLAAMGFLTVGRRFSNNINDIIDDRIDVVSRGLLGLSVTCARCHDHKFDPIPTDDYYSLYGVFASSTEPAEPPLLNGLPQTEAYKKFETELHNLQQAREEFHATKRIDAQEQARAKAAEYLRAAWESRTKDGPDRKSPDPQRLRPLLVRRWAVYLNRMSERMSETPNAVFVAWREFAQLPEKQFAARSGDVLAKLEAAPTASEATGRINTVVRDAFIHTPPKSMRDVVAQYGKLLVEAERRWKRLVKDSPRDKPPLRLPDANWEELRQILYREDSPAFIAADDVKRVLDRAARNQLTKLDNKIEALRANSPAAPPRGMVLNDLPTPVEPVVFVRGNPGRPGRQVPRRFLQAVGIEGGRLFKKGSGRLELAESIVSPRNPLTARVIVNRIWMHHFGAGIVRTPSDFGIRGSAPSHRELLDYLASQFVREDWSIKKLQREIVLSAVYQQASVLRPDQQEKDPENKLLWRKNPSRLEFEPMRDSWLAVAGDLDLRLGGRAFDIQSAADRGRRTVYAFIDRQDLPQLFHTFDFASPDVSTAQRPQTTIPQQALFALNSPFLLAQTRALIRADDGKDTLQRVASLYRRVYARDPSGDELRSAVAYVDGSKRMEPPDDVVSAWHYGYGTIDPEAKRVREFHDLPRFVDKRWGGSKLPDSKLGWVHLTARGGHPGSDAAHSAIRRWVSPLAGEIEIRGTLEHPSPDGDGIRGWIISSRQGLFKEWDVKHEKRPTNVDSLTVEPGEVIDFVVDCRGTDESDGFAWAPVIKTKQAAGSPNSIVQLWHSTNDFSGPAPPRLTAWEQLAQALLVSNEFVFVD